MSDLYKQAAAERAIQDIEDDMIIGVGSGTTIGFFISALAAISGRIEGCVASSENTAQLLKQHRIPVLDLNGVPQVDIYVDSADEVNQQRLMIKGGGGALTREKLVSQVSLRFTGIVSIEKKVEYLGQFPIAVEVLPMARSYVARTLLRWGGNPVYREGFVTDNGNVILDVYDLDLHEPIALEAKIKGICGVIESGLFATRLPEVVYVAGPNGITSLD